MSEDPITKPVALLEVTSLEKKFRSFETAFLCIVWNEILETVYKCSDNLPKQTMHLSVVTKQIYTLEAFINEKREWKQQYHVTVQFILKTLIH